MPSIVIGIVAYAVVVRPMKHFSALAGGVALGIMMIPIAVRTTEEFLRAVPNSLREGSLALGATKAKTIFSVVVPAAISGLDLRADAQPGARGRRNGPSVVYSAGQYVLEPRLDGTDCNSPGYDLQLCDRAGRRPSSAGVGRGLCIARACFGHQCNCENDTYEGTSSLSEIMWRLPDNNL